MPAIAPKKIENNLVFRLSDGIAAPLRNKGFSSTIDKLIAIEKNYTENSESQMEAEFESGPAMEFSEFVMGLEEVEMNEGVALKL